MSIAPEHQDEISRLRNKVQCSKDYKCIESETEDLCEVMAIGKGDEAVLRCVGREPCSSGCSLVFGYEMRLCSCPLRDYIWRKIGK